VTDYTVPKVHYLAGSRSVPAGTHRSQRTAPAAATRLAPGLGLIVALLFSLGLWGSMWLAASSLAAAWFR